MSARDGEWNQQWGRCMYAAFPLGHCCRRVISHLDAYISVIPSSRHLLAVHAQLFLLSCNRNRCQVSLLTSPRAFNHSSGHVSTRTSSRPPCFTQNDTIQLIPTITTHDICTRQLCSGRSRRTQLSIWSTDPRTSNALAVWRSKPNAAPSWDAIGRLGRRLTLRCGIQIMFHRVCHCRVNGGIMTCTSLLCRIIEQSIGQRLSGGCGDSLSGGECCNEWESARACEGTL